MAKLFTPLAVGAAVACLASAASAQTTQPEWHVPPDGWMRDAPDTFVPPLPGRVALDWVYGARYDNPDAVVWNPARQRIIDGEDLVGGTLRTGSPEEYCAVANAGYDFTWVEMQHSPIDISQMAAMYAACPDATATHGVRISETTETQIQRALDTGAMVLVVPTVDSYEEALEIVQWTYFPPMGKRSAGGGQAFQMYSDVPGGYRNSFNDNIVLILMIETLWGVEDVERIANIPGVHAIFAASGDLGNFTGYAPGEAPYEWVITQIHDAAMDAGIRLCGPMSWHPARNADGSRADFTCFQGGTNAEADLRERL